MVQDEKVVNDAVEKYRIISCWNCSQKDHRFEDCPISVYFTMVVRPKIYVNESVLNARSYDKAGLKPFWVVQFQQKHTSLNSASNQNIPTESLKIRLNDHFELLHFENHASHSPRTFAIECSNVPMSVYLNTIKLSLESLMDLYLFLQFIKELNYPPDNVVFGNLF